MVVPPFWMGAISFVIGLGSELPADAETNKKQEENDAGDDSCDEKGSNQVA